MWDYRPGGKTKRWQVQGKVRENVNLEGAEEQMKETQMTREGQDEIQKWGRGRWRVRRFSRERPWTPGLQQGWRQVNPSPQHFPSVTWKAEMMVMWLRLEVHEGEVLEQ